MPFVRGAAVLAAAGLLSRLLGLYRLVLPRLIGPTGVGLYHMAYPIYALTLVLSTGGLPVAVSKLVAEELAAGRGRGAWRLFALAAWVMAGLGLVFASLLTVGARWIAEHLAGDPRAELALRAVAPAVFLVGLLAAARGLFQGLQAMGPAAASQVVEQVVRVGTLLGLVVLLRPRGEAWAAAGAAFGATAGALAGCLYLLPALLGARARLVASGAPTRAHGSGAAALRRLVALAAPVALASLALPLSQLLDLALVPSGLRAGGLAYPESTARYGELAGYAMPVVGLIGVINAALSAALVPAVAQACAQRRDPRVPTRAALKAAALAAAPAAVGFWWYGDQITGLLFGDPRAGALLRDLAPGVLLWGLGAVAAGALQGAGEAALVLANVAAGVVAKGAVTWAAVPALGVRGAALGTSVSLALTAVLNLRALRRKLGAGWAGGDLLRVAVAALFMGAVAACAQAAARLGSLGPVGLAAGAALSAAAYPLALVGLRAVSARDWARALRPRAAGRSAGAARRTTVKR